MKTTTIRYRNHLNYQSPWGSGPNTAQTFIISIDKSTAICLVSPCEGKELPGYLEIEIEIDRNTSTLVRDLAELPHDEYVEKHIMIVIDLIANKD